MTAHEEEHTRIARDLHDGIGQWLTSIRIRLEIFNEKLRGGENPSVENMAALVSDLKTAMDDTRRIVRDMSPMFLEEHGLSAAIKGHVNTIAQSSECSVFIDVEEDLHLDKTKQNHVFRIFQEAINNAAKHSECGKIHIGLSKISGNIELTVEDNGSGFSLEEKHTKNASGIGLKTMSERARLLGGQLAIKSNPGKGTIIELQFPVG